jgi:hypothetical protein
MNTMNLSAQTTIALPDMQKPHQIAVDGNDLYIFDEADYSLHVYTISPFALRLKFGRKGDGSQDFKDLPFAYVQLETLACTDFTKIIWFSKKGEVLKVMKFSDLKDFDLTSDRRLCLPLASVRPQRGVLRYDLFTVGQEKLYELIQNHDTGK